MGTEQALWRHDPRLAHRLHPEHPDDVRILLHDGGPIGAPPPPERVWVRIVGQFSADVYTAVLLNRPHRLTRCAAGDLLHFAVSGSGAEPVHVSRRHLDERARWTVEPCDRCGLFEVFEAPSDLRAAYFSEPAPGADTMVVFTSTCPVCGGTQIVGLRDEAADQPGVARLVDHLADHLVLDVTTELGRDGLHALLDGDPSPTARALREKLTDDRAVNDMLLVVADLLLDRVTRHGFDDVLRDVISGYAR